MRNIGVIQTHRQEKYSLYIDTKQYTPRHEKYGLYYKHADKRNIGCI